MFRAKNSFSPTHIQDEVADAAFAADEQQFPVSSRSRLIT
jgi:hypothetical protein